MLYTVNAFASCTVQPRPQGFSLFPCFKGKALGTRLLRSAGFEFQPYIMKIYSLCIRAREREEVEKKVQKIKALLILSFMAFYAHV